MGESGRPPKYKTPEEMQKKIENYFSWCDSREVDIVTKKGDVVTINKPRPYTVSGLCLFLDINRSTLLRYEEKEEFRNTVTRAKMKIENDVEEGGLDGRYDSRMVQFNLKNNFSDIWKDKQEVEQTNKGEQTFNIKFVDDE